MITNLEDFKAYNHAMVLAESIWGVVELWTFFQKDTVGKQLVRAADSIAANLSEGLGRYHYKEKKNFSYYSRGSLFETQTWLTKAANRKLISNDQFKKLMTDLENIRKMINGYIRSIGTHNTPQENEI